MSNLEAEEYLLVGRVLPRCPKDNLRREVVHLDQIDDLSRFPPFFKNLDKLDNVFIQKSSLLPQSFRREGR